MTLESIYAKKKDLTDDDYFGENGLKRYYTEIGKYPILTREEERTLLVAAKDGDIEARNFLVSCNLRFIFVIINKYRNRDTDIEDLLELGAIGLIKAIDNYDINNEVRLLTYAGYYIKKELSRGIRYNKRGISVGVHMDLFINKYQIAVINLQNKLMRTPTIEEIAKEMDISMNKLSFIIKAYNALQVINMDSYNLIDGEETTLANVLIDPNSNFEQEVIDKIIKQKLSTLIPDIKEVINNEEQFNALMLYIVKKLPIKEINPTVPYKTTNGRIGLALYKIRTDERIIQKYIELSDNPEGNYQRIKKFIELYKKPNYRSYTFLNCKKLTKKL